MCFCIYLTALQVVQTEAVDKSPPKVSGYLGESITLPSAVDSSWRLIKIEWSIFTNITLIATYRNGKINTERVPQYTGRLTLNTTSGDIYQLFYCKGIVVLFLSWFSFNVFYSIGDLTIHKLKEGDAIEYTVEVFNSEGKRKTNQIKITAKRKWCINKTVLIMKSFIFWLFCCIISINHLLFILFKDLQHLWTITDYFECTHAA